MPPHAKCCLKHVLFHQHLERSFWRTSRWCVHSITAISSVKSRLILYGDIMLTVFWNGGTDSQAGQKQMLPVDCDTMWDGGIRRSEKDCVKRCMGCDVKMWRYPGLPRLPKQNAWDEPPPPSIAPFPPSSSSPIPIPFPSSPLPSPPLEVGLLKSS